MRALLIAAITLLAAACAGQVQESVTSGHAEWPFPNAPRGSAIAPPATGGGAGQTAPPEGRGPGGIDFGQWKSADPAAYQPTFQTQIRARYANQDAAAIRADLEHNGFACRDSAPMQCRIEIMERQCAFDWYVVIERSGAAPVAGFDQMCLGAR